MSVASSAQPEDADEPETRALLVEVLAVVTATLEMHNRALTMQLATNKAALKTLEHVTRRLIGDDRAVA